MKHRGASVIAALAVAISLISAAPAEASIKPSPQVAQEATDSVGFIVKYEPNVSAIAPNGEPTGENYAGVDLENSRDLGSGYKSVDFAADLTPEQASAALERLTLDPRVKSASLNRIFQAADLIAKPIMGSVIGNRDALDLPVVVRSAVKLAAAPTAQAVDAWASGTTPRVRISWSKPGNTVSGKIVGYKLQVYTNGAWKTMVSRTASTTRSFYPATTNLKAGTQAKFRIAAVTLYSGRYYTGSYRTVYATPTALPRANTHLLVQTVGTEVRFSFSPLISQYDMGGLQVSYNLTVIRDGVTETCSSQTATTCVISPAVEGGVYNATLSITNDHGTVAAGSLSTTFTGIASVNSSDDTYFVNQWHLKSGVASPYGMKVTDAWATEAGLNTVNVAVLDTGITSHPDLNANVIGGYDMVSDVSSANDGNGRDSDPSDPGDWDSTETSSWHGTHVAGIIAAVDNSIGVLGVAPNVKIVPVRVLGIGGGSEADIVAGLNWAAGIHITGIPDNTHIANVINMSIGGAGTCFTGSPSQTALAAIKAKGITVVTAAGNESGNAFYSYPGNCVPTINVGATGKTGKPAFYSNWGDGVDISAPGGDFCTQSGTPQNSGDIYSTLNDGDTNPGNPSYGYSLGTSMAAPAVAGVAALLYSAILRETPNVTKDAALVNRVVLAMLDHTTALAGQTPPYDFDTTVGSPTYNKCVAYSGSSRTYGSGIVDANAALAAILQ